MGPQSGCQAQDDTGAQLGRGGQLPYKKDGDACQNFVKESLRGTNFKSAYYFVSYFFRFSTVTGTAADPNEHLSRLNTVAKTSFLTPKMFNRHICPFFL